MNRRTVVRTIGGGTVAGLAGCMTRDEDDDDDPPDDPVEADPEPDEPDHEGALQVVTYRSMVMGPNPAGPWLKDRFEEAYPEATLEWVVPDAGVEHYITRGEYEAEINADVCLGFSVGDLARIDERIGSGGLFRRLNRDRIEGVDRIREELEFEDPHGRALPYDAGYVSLVYDERAVAEPETFADLLESEYADALLAHHPVTSLPGQAFLLWAIETGGPDEAMDYWENLADNGVRVHETWSDAYYGSYLNGDRPLIVSYSTDPLFATTEGHPPERHRIAFLDDEGYALPEGMGIFQAATEPDLAYAFLELVLSSEVQLALARRNVQFPAVGDIGLNRDITEGIRRPPTPVSLSYTELQGMITEWLETWTERFDERLFDDGDRHEDESD